ncbi:MAG: pantoate--beta-alanine ligase [Ignavibacteria bacterium]|nr:pantoate--beta-alanine ligase [Ignavibacteria bacterium]
MNTVHDIREMQRLADAHRAAGRRIGFVPTMGFLHDGHLSLITAAKAQCDVVVVSIFVNPTQFGAGEDLDRYPRDLARDAALAERAGCDTLFVPEEGAMYPPGYGTAVDCNGVASTLEGASRPGHFRGVTTVVAKLFNIVKPHVAVFGQKDAQQALILKKMSEELNFDVDLQIAPTVRESDGLAMSSRNAYLDASDRAAALSISRGLREAEAQYRNGERSADTLRRTVEHEMRLAGLTIDYVALVDARTLEEMEMLERPALLAVAARAGSTRLIDNVVLQER